LVRTGLNPETVLLEELESGGKDLFIGDILKEEGSGLEEKYSLLEPGDRTGLG
jgi:hypothetical protein